MMSTCTGNLVISGVQASDEGTYVCRADNGVGQPQASVAYLLVKRTHFLILN